MGHSESKACGSVCSTGELDSRSRHIGELVDKAISKQIDPRQVPHETKMVAAQAEDKTRPLKAVATDFVVAEYFATTDTLYQFLTLVHDIYTEALGLYRSERNLQPTECLFIFKGGNILRVVAHEFLDELPEYATEEIRQFYEPFFKRSDNDFSILLDPRVPNYDLTFAEVTTLAYHLQDYIRSLFMSDLERYFDFARYKPDFKQKVYARWLPKFTETGLGDFVSMRSGSGPDKALRYVNDDYGADERQVATSVLQNSGTPLVITHNDSLQFPDEDGNRIAFNLTRTKVAFLLKQKDGSETPVNGELIDVSVPHKTDAMIGHFFEHVEDNIATYELDVSMLGREPLSFIASSLSYLTSDLETVLFFRSHFPWNDSKYGKRMNRLVYLYFIDLFIKVKTGPERVKLLADVRSLISGQNQVNSRSARTKRPQGGSKSLPSDLLFGNLVENVRRLRQEVPTSPELEEMITLILKNIDFLSETLQKVHTYCTTDGMVSVEDIYEGKSGSLI